MDGYQACYQGTRAPGPRRVGLVRVPRTASYVTAKGGLSALTPSYVKPDLVSISRHVAQDALGPVPRQLGNSLKHMSRRGAGRGTARKCSHVLLIRALGLLR